MSSFAFRASAVALGGMFTRPFNEPLPGVAASALPSVGGYGSARVEAFRFHQLVSCAAAYTQVIGVEYDLPDGGRERSTLALAVVEGLNILDVVTADRVVGRLVSETPVSGEADQQPPELTWLPAGSYFVNLRIAGQLVSPVPHARLIQADGLTHGGVQKILESEQATLVCSMFDQHRPIPVPGFGDVFLGEYIVKEDYRKLTMIRVAMHSPAGGDVAVASLEGNGIQY